MTLKSVASAMLLAVASAAYAQPPSGLTPPTMTPSDTPSQSQSVAPSQSPYVAPSQPPSETPSVTPSQSSGATAPTAPRAVGGMSQCQNLIGADRDKCLQEERAAMPGGGAGAGTTAPPAGSIR